MMSYDVDTVEGTSFQSRSSTVGTTWHPVVGKFFATFSASNLARGSLTTQTNHFNIKKCYFTPGCMHVPATSATSLPVPSSAPFVRQGMLQPCPGDLGFDQHQVINGTSTSNSGNNAPTPAPSSSTALSRRSIPIKCSQRYKEAFH